MSEDEAEFLRHLYDAYNRGEVESALDRVGPEFEFHEPAEFPGAHVYKGRDGLLEALRNAASVFDEVHIDLEKVIQAGHRLVAFIRISGRGKGSGAPVEIRVAHVWTMRDGRAIRMQVYLDRNEAVEGAGLPEEE